jgi:hypothetical protein
LFVFEKDWRSRNPSQSHSRGKDTRELTGEEMERDGIEFFAHWTRENIGDIGVEGEDRASMQDVRCKIVGRRCSVQNVSTKTLADGGKEERDKRFVAEEVAGTASRKAIVATRKH